MQQVRSGLRLSLYVLRLGAEGESWEDFGVISNNTINNFAPNQLSTFEWMMSRRPHNSKDVGVYFLVGGHEANLLVDFRR